MKTKLQITLIVFVLLTVGFGSAIYKRSVLGFSFLPKEKVNVWTVEAGISFEAEGGPVEVSLNLPDTSDTLTVMDLKSTDKNLHFTPRDGRAVWSGDMEKGKKNIYLRATVTRHNAGKQRPFSSQITVKDFSPSAAKAADNLLQKVTEKQLSSTETALMLLEQLNETENPSTRILHEEADYFGGKIKMACALLGRGHISARAVKGLQLTETKTSKTLKSYIEISENNEIVLLNPRAAKKEPRETFLLWQQGEESILDLIGAGSGKLNFSILQDKLAAERVAVLHGTYTKDWFIDFSIYSLPIKDQNTFKLLLLIPIGALVVVILRNLVGIPTSGTFMPILIAMVFLQTKLITGLALFLIVVSVGLILRSYLSHLNLLLVPRISAVLVFVIIIYLAISVTSDKLGIQSGMQVTFFPMIIISWTIERMSVLWEEEGPKDVFKQGSGSLFAASLIYLTMSNKYIGHLTYSFPELLLVVLAVIIMIGSYSGYRLTELRRFEPLSSKE